MNTKKRTGSGSAREFFSASSANRWLVHDAGDGPLPKAGVGREVD